MSGVDTNPFEWTVLKDPRIEGHHQLLGVVGKPLGIPLKGVENPTQVTLTLALTLTLSLSLALALTLTLTLT